MISLDKRIELLEAYYKEFGDISNIKKDDVYVYNGKKVNIGRLIEILRVQYKMRYKSEEEIAKSKVRPLTDEEVDALNKIGIKWNPTSFETRIAPLVDYYKNNGSIAKIVEADKYSYDGKNVKIGRLVVTLRKQYRLRFASKEDREKTTYVPLKDEEVTMLEKIGMKWEVLSFEIRISSLLDYFKKNGTISNIGVNDKYVYDGKTVNIGRLISTLRIQYKLRSASEDDKLRDDLLPLTDEEVNWLESMGMIWDAMDFELRIATLVSYFNEYGTISNIGVNDTYFYNGVEENIGTLIRNLRIQYKLRNASEEERARTNLLPLTDEEVKRLEELGMVWNAMSFESRIAPLVAYFKEYGSLFNIGVNDTYVCNGKVENIGGLVALLRKQYKLRDMSEETKKKVTFVPLTDKEVNILEEMGIVWDAMSFKARVAPLVAYYEKYGTIRNITASTKFNYFGKEVNIGRLISTFRIQYKLRNAREEDRAKTNSLPLKDKEVEMLEKMGMVWEVRQKR